MAKTMAEQVDVVTLFVNVVDKGIPHCRICYRTSKEIPLVRPNKLLDFASTFKLQNLFGSSALDKSACMLCESVAATAVRLRDALSTASNVKEIFEIFKQNLTHHKKYREKYLHENVKPCNERLNSYRERTTFKQTEVLVIDSLGLEWSNKSTGKKPTRVDLSAGARVDPPIETVVLDDDEEISTASQVISQTPLQSTNVNLQTSTAPKKLVPINDLINKIVDKCNYAALVPNKPQIITGHESLTEHFILHDIVVEKDGTLTVPGISSEIKDGYLKYNPLLVTKRPVFLIQPPDLNEPAKNYVQNAINQNMSLPAENVKTKPVADKKKNKSKNSQNKSNDLLIVHDANNSNNKDINGRFLGTLTRTLNNSSNDDGESSINILDIQESTETSEKSTDTIEFVEVDNILRRTLENHKRNAKSNVDLTKNSVEVTKNFVDSTKKPRMELKVNMNKNNSCLQSEERPLAVISSVTSQAVQLQAETSASVETLEHSVEINVPKRPIEQKGNIDWENKIPMDVISFMDATDPNAADLIVPDRLPQPPETFVVKDETEDYVIEIG